VLDSIAKQRKPATLSSPVIHKEDERA
jgi:hypothetical protein